MKKMLSGAFLGLIFLFLYFPIIILAVYSFTNATMIGKMRGFSLHNYITLFTSPELVSMIWGTIVLALVVSFISTILGTLGAIGSFYSKKKVQTTIEIANQIPVVNADVVTGFSICILLIVFLGVRKDSYVPLVVGLTSLCTPFVYLSVKPRLQMMDPNLYEAALDLGCTPAQALYKVIFRELLPGILSGFMTSITLSLDDYFITTYTKPAMFDTISTYVVNATRGAQTQIKTALWALSTVIFLVVVLSVVLINVRAQRKMKKLSKYHSIGLLLLCCIVFGTTGCTHEKKDAVVLRVANCEEYIDEGDWDEEETIVLENGTEILGENSMVEDFETWYEQTYGQKVRVEYSTYGTNEELYNQMSLGNVFDVVCPSEYMIMKLMSENRVMPFSDSFFDREDENNYYIKGVSPYFQTVFSHLKMNGKPLSKYGAGYMWGNMGIVYHPDYVSEEELQHWNVLLNPKYYKQITMKDGVRDSYFVGLAIAKEQKLLSEEFTSQPDYLQQLETIMNDTSQKTVNQVENVLSEMRKNAYSLETDSGKADMVTGKVVANMQWSGDAVYTLDQAEEDGVKLSYAVPRECSNIWFDGWCMMKDGISEDVRKQHAAQAFINFLSRPDNVVRNMYYIGYTSAIAGGENDTIFEYAKYCYEAEDEEDAVAYPLGYFFGNRGEVRDTTQDDKEYTIMTDPDQLNRQLFAQYPPKETIQRSAIMKCFDTEANQRISQMWTNIRCFDLTDLFTK